MGVAPTNAPTIVHVVGSQLAGATAVAVGPLRGAIVTNTPTELAFTISVPHAAPLGVQPVTVTTAEGTQSFATGVTITPIIASPAGSDDAVDGGTSVIGTETRPFRSLTKAMTIAAPGDTVLLKDGRYDQAHGESFPTRPSSGFATPNVPAGVTIKGESLSGTLIIGPPKNACDSRVGLVLGDQSRIETLDISGFCTGISASVGTVSVRDVTVHDAGEHGILLQGASSWTLENVDATNNGSTGAALYDSATAVFTNGHMTKNPDYGVLSRSTNSLTVTGTEFSENGSGSDAGNTRGGLTSLDLKAPAILTITGAKFHDNRANGLGINHYNRGGAIISDSVFKDNQPFNVGIGGAANGEYIRFRRSTFTGAVGVGAIYLNGSPVDFGSEAGAGENTFSVCDSCVAINNDRADGAPSPVTVRGNKWLRSTGEQLTPRVGCFNMAVAPFWSITHPAATCNSPLTDNVMLN